MATLDDKLLGEKLQNYCSSSSEEEEENENDNQNTKKSNTSSMPKFIPESQIKENENAYGAGGSSTNTGPKGVIKDWQRFKQLEHEKNQEAQKERLKLAKKLALTCRSDELDKEMPGLTCKAGTSNNEDVLMEDMEGQLLQDEFFQQYVKQKFEEMHKKTLQLPRFGKVIELTSDMFLNEIDKENKSVSIIVHIYDQKMPECKLMNDCLEIISKDYLMVKICKVKSTEIDLSDKFRKTGCPALLIYKNAELIGNFVKMAEEFGDEFCASDVENFLLEQGFLPSLDLPTSIRTGNLYKGFSEDTDD